MADEVQVEYRGNLAIPVKVHATCVCVYLCGEPWGNSASPTIVPTPLCLSKHTGNL